MSAVCCWLLGSCFTVGPTPWCLSEDSPPTEPAIATITTISATAKARAAKSRAEALVGDSIGPFGFESGALIVIAQADFRRSGFLRGRDLPDSRPQILRRGCRVGRSCNSPGGRNQGRRTPRRKGGAEQLRSAALGSHPRY